MATDLWKLRSDVGHERADLDGRKVEAIDVDDARIKVDRTKDEIKSAPDLDEGLTGDAAYHESLTRDDGATSSHV